MPRLDMEVNQKKRSHLVEILSHVLNELCNQPHTLGFNQSDRSCFDSVQPPPIKLECYLKRIAKFSGCSIESLIFSLIYIDRLIISSDNSFLVTSSNVHRLLLASVLVAVKFYDDQYFNNAFFSKVGGVSRNELNVLETEFLFLINFNLFVDMDLYERYNERLMCCSVAPSGLEKIRSTSVTEEFPYISVLPLPENERNCQSKTPTAVQKLDISDHEQSETVSAYETSSEGSNICSQEQNYNGISQNFQIKSPRKRCSNVVLFLKQQKISRQGASKSLMGKA